MIYTDMTKKALKLSFEAHKDQVDKSGMPYVYHPFHLAEQMKDEDTTIVALLHDVVEDTDITVDDIRKMGFSNEVCKALSLMTHDDSVPYMDYIKKLKGNQIAKTVKLADLKHNSDMTRLDVVRDKDRQRVKKYKEAELLLSAEYRYEYDADGRVLIRLMSDELPQIIRKDELIWRRLGSDVKDEPYHRAIYIGQGCWEKLRSIDEKEANGILFKWGYYDIQSVIQKKEKREKYLDKIRGSLFGGAIGDALGYPVEFLRDYQIFQKYGDNGITEYSLTNGIAQISDDTQMALFTANGILFGDTRLAMRGIGGDPSGYVPMSYQDWLITQTKAYKDGKETKRYGSGCGISWLLDVPELYARRAPGNTCLSALAMRKNMQDHNFLKNPINNSKGCGGIMRIAPLAIHYEASSKEWLVELQKKAAEITAITHGHSLGYMPSAVLSQIINQIIYPLEDKSLKEIIADARDNALNIFADDKNIEVLKNLIDKAIELSENGLDDLDNIRVLGEGWVAEETLAIAIYCSLKYKDDFSKGIIAAVNHSGDSDSTGAVTGNILGAIVGYDKIEDKWKSDIELKDVLIEMADDLCYGCLMSEYSRYSDNDWVRKYIDIYCKEQGCTT